MINTTKQIPKVRLLKYFEMYSNSNISICDGEGDLIAFTL